MNKIEKIADGSKSTETLCYAVNQGDKVEVNIKFKATKSKWNT